MAESLHPKTGLEACLFDGNLDFDEILELLFMCGRHGIDIISVPSSMLQYHQQFTSRANTACLIDFPLGMGSLRSRIASCIEAINAGVKTLDICCNPMYIHNFQRKTIRQDIQSVSQLCKDRGVAVRYIFNYRPYSLREYITMCSFLYEAGVETIITHDGMTVDDPTDNLIFAEAVARDVPISVIPSSLMFEPCHLDLISGTKLKHLRVCSSKIMRFFEETAYN